MRRPIEKGETHLRSARPFFISLFCPFLPVFRASSEDVHRAP